MPNEETTKEEVTAPEEQPKPATTRRSRKAKMFALVSAYPLVHPRTHVRFTQNANIEHEKDNWIEAQMGAGLMVEVK